VREGIFVNIIILVVSVVGAFFIYKISAAIIAKWLPKTLWAKPIYTMPGLGLGLVYLYYAGYYIMDKNSNYIYSLVIALAPWILYIAMKIAARTRIIEE
jgi:hypothetical protein